MATDEQIEMASRAYHSQVATVRALQLERDTKLAESEAAQVKLTAALVQLKDKKKNLKDALNAN